VFWKVSATTAAARQRVVDDEQLVGVGGNKHASRNAVSDGKLSASVKLMIPAEPSCRSRSPAAETTDRSNSRGNDRRPVSPVETACQERATFGLPALVHGSKNPVDLFLRAVVALLRLWRSHVDSRASPLTYQMSCRNSDCQFSSVSRMACTTNSLTSGCCPCRNCSATNAYQPNAQCPAKLAIDNPSVTHKYPYFRRHCVSRTLLRHARRPGYRQRSPVRAGEGYLIDPRPGNESRRANPPDPPLRTGGFTTFSSHSALHEADHGWEFDDADVNTWGVSIEA
jgi:hypothetical protein